MTDSTTTVELVPKVSLSQSGITTPVATQAQALRTVRQTARSQRHELHVLIQDGEHPHRAISVLPDGSTAETSLDAVTSPHAIITCSPWTVSLALPQGTREITTHSSRRALEQLPTFAAAAGVALDVTIHGLADAPQRVEILPSAVNAPENAPDAPIEDSTIEGQEGQLEHAIEEVFEEAEIDGDVDALPADDELLEHRIEADNLPAGLAELDDLLDASTPPSSDELQSATEPETTPPHSGAEIVAKADPKHQPGALGKFSPHPLQAVRRTIGRLPRPPRPAIRLPKKDRTARPVSTGSTAAAATRALPIRALVLVLALLLVLVFAGTFAWRLTSASAGTPQISVGAPMDPAAYEQTWTHDFPADAVVTGFDTAITIHDGKTLTLLDPATGAEIEALKAKGQIDWITESVIDDRLQLVWKTTDSRDVHLWDREAKEPVTITHADGSSISDAGSGLLLTSAEGAAYRIHDGKFDEMPTPRGKTPMAVDGDTLVSSDGSPRITLSDTNGRVTREVELAAPDLDAPTLDRWITAGHGLAVTVWTQGRDQQALVVSSLEDGSIRSTVKIEHGTNHRWMRGQGYDRAAWGPFLISMTDGSLIADATDQGLTFGRPQGVLGLLPRDNDTSLVTAGTTAQSLTEPVVAETESTLVLQSTSGTLTAYKLPTT